MNQITQYGYDELGNQITQTDALGRVTRFEYDKLGRRTKRTLPLGQVETYTYNSAGNLLTRRDFNAKTTTYAYDAMNRLLSKTPDLSFAAPAVTFTYSSTGRRLSMNDAHGLTSYIYDSRDRLLSKGTPEGTLSYTYDSASNLLSLRSSNTNGASIDYGYDSLNRLSTVTGNAPATGNRPATGTTTYRYDDVGNLAGYLYPNGVDTSYQYNSLNRLTSMSISKTSSPLASFAYELAPAGNRLSVTELSGRKASYTYDDLYRLTRETITIDPVAANNGSISYAYDAVGNRLSRTSTVAAIQNQTPTVDANDRLASDTYDSNGNTTASAEKTYTFDFENRIKSVNSGQIVFVYDGDGNRVAKTVGGVMTKFLVDTSSATGYAQVVEEIVGGTVQRAYVHGHSLISQTQLISSNWVTSFYGYDGHGSVRLLTDTTGAITDTYTYDAFGSLIASTGTTPNNYLYAGEQLDPNLGFYYQRARYMNPSSGRFWTMDSFEGTVFDPSSLHKYLYTSGNPVNNVDPSGNFEFTIAGLSVNFSIQGILKSMAVGAFFGAIYSAGEAYFKDEDIADAALKGALVGAFLGPLGRIKAIARFVQIAGTALAADAAFQAYSEGNTGLALYRGIFFVAGLRGIVSTRSALVNTGEVSVYRSVNPETGEVQYVGITKNLVARAAAHLRQKGIEIEEIGGLDNLSIDDARAVEQVLINYYGLGKNSGTLINKINSIAETNPKYSGALQRGMQLLEQATYPFER